MTELAEVLAGYTRQPVVLGHSGAAVYRLVAPGKPALFVKEAATNLHEEAARLGWLRSKLPVPEVVHFCKNGHSSVLVTTAVPGVNLAHFNDESPDVKRRLVEVLAEALRQFHAVDTYECPFDHSAGRELGRLETELSALEAATGETPNVRRARQKLAELRHNQPAETLVLTHGDACLPNILVQDFELSGFVDLGAAGLGDKWRDLERACWSLGYNYGAGYDELFLRAYGVSGADRERLGFYRELESFSLGSA